MAFQSGSEVADVAAAAGSDSSRDPAPDDDDDVGCSGPPLPQILHKMWKDMNQGAND